VFAGQRDWADVRRQEPAGEEFAGNGGIRITITIRIRKRIKSKSKRKIKRSW